MLAPRHTLPHTDSPTLSFTHWPAYYLSHTAISTFLSRCYSNARRINIHAFVATLRGQWPIYLCSTQLRACPNERRMFTRAHGTITRPQNSFPVHQQFTGRVPTSLLHSFYSPGQVAIISIEIWKYHTPSTHYSVRDTSRFTMTGLAYNWNSFLSLVHLL